MIYAMALCVFCHLVFLIKWCSCLFFAFVCFSSSVQLVDCAMFLLRGVNSSLSFCVEEMH